MASTGRRAAGLPRQATIRDVAARAGVSIATVSRVFRGHDSVAPATRDRVLAAAESLTFRPSRLGRSLAERQHTANGIVFPDLSGPYYAEVVLGYEAVASELGRSVLILSTHGRPAAVERVLDLASRVDGMVILGRTVRDEVVRQVARSIPVVVLARPALEGDDAVDSINADNATSARTLARHLVETGVRCPVFVGDVESSPDAAERWRAAAEELARAGIELPPMQSGMAETDGAAAAAELAAAGRLERGGLDAVICANDELALGVLGALAEHGVDVPGDVAVTGWDDVMAARWAGLTTVRQPMRELGQAAARALDERIRGLDAPSRHVVLHTELVVRRTTG